MKILAFTDAISKDSLNFSTVHFFDEYFSFSRRKYRVIEPCTIDDRQGYRVETQYVQQNIPLTILKVLSFMTIIIPLIMGIGKLIARSQYCFFIETQNKHTLSPLEKVTQERADCIKEFTRRALSALHNPLRKPAHIVCAITQEQSELLLQANREKYYQEHPFPGVTSIRGGINCVLLLESAPQCVFKPMEGRKQAENYVALVDRAHEVVARNNLFLLKVPESRILEINGQYFIMQEKANLISENHIGQKGVYSYCWREKTMEHYIKTVITQLIRFIAATDFGDVKYDNIPFTIDGQVALIDLDNTSALIGLTKGTARSNNGLFNYIPPEYLDEFLSVAKELLPEVTYQQCVQKMVDIKARAEKKAKKYADYSHFVQTNSIFYPSQNITFNLSKVFDDDTKKQQLAHFLMESLNQTLSCSKNFDIKAGRTIILKSTSRDPLIKRANEIWGQKFTYLPFKTHLLPKVLERLKTAGYLHKFKMSPSYSYLKVLC